MDLTKSKILIIDDEKQNLFILEAFLKKLGITEIRKAVDGEQGLSMILKQKPDLVITDVMMPKINGFELCKSIKDNENLRNIPVILITALEGIHDKITGIDAGADDFISKPFNRLILEARIKNLLKIKYLNDMLKTDEEVILSFATAIEIKDPFTEGHIKRVTNLTLTLARVLNIEGYELESMQKGAVLHDIGKLSIPDAILKKQGPLTEEEYQKMKKHPEIGEAICKPLRTNPIIMDMIRHHHEKLDGSGYPDMLKGDEISKFSRILSVVDIYDSLTTIKPWRKEVTKEESFKILRNEVEQGFWDKDVVEIFIRIIEKGL